MYIRCRQGLYIFEVCIQANKYIFGGLSIHLGIYIYSVGYIYGNMCILRGLCVWEYIFLGGSYIWGNTYIFEGISKDQLWHKGC